MRLPTSLPGHTHAAAFVHVSHLMGGVHQRGGRRAAHRAAHRGAVGPERSGRSILKLTSLCRCAGPREAAFCILRAMRHRGCNRISGRANSVKSVSLTCSKLFLSVPELGRWGLKRGRGVGGKTYSVPTYSGRAREAQNRDFRMLRWCTRRHGIETTHLWQHPWHPLCPCQTAQGLILNPASAVSSRYIVPNYMLKWYVYLPRRR